MKKKPLVKSKISQKIFIGLIAVALIYLGFQLISRMFIVMPNISVVNESVAGGGDATRNGGDATRGGGDATRFTNKKSLLKYWGFSKK